MKNWREREVNIHYMFVDFFDNESYIIFMTEENVERETSKETLPQEFLELLSTLKIYRERKHLYKNTYQFSKQELLSFFEKTPYRLIENWNLG